MAGDPLLDPVHLDGWLSGLPDDELEAVEVIYRLVARGEAIRWAWLDVDRLGRAGRATAGAIAMTIANYRADREPMLPELERLSQRVERARRAGEAARQTNIRRQLENQWKL